jgi:hypothetical protein
VGKLDHEIDLAKRAKVIEWLKTELIEQNSRLFKGMWEGNNPQITDSLASLIMSGYILGRRLGISYRELDEAMIGKLKKHREEGHQLEEWYQDISVLEDHFYKR